MSAWDGEDRFSLLLLEDGEYYFRDFNCHLLKDAEHRVAGQLKVCSASLYFVPRDVHEPIFRLPYRATTSIARDAADKTTSGEDLLLVVTSERTEMKYMNCSAPYVRHRGQMGYLFALVYTSLDDILPRVHELWTVGQKDDTKEGRQAAKERLAQIIQEHEKNERFNPGWLEDENERIVLELVGNCITPLCSQPGRVVLTASRIYFQPFNVASNSPIQTYHLSKVVSVMMRTYQLQPNGLEIFFSGRNSLYLTFRTQEERKRCDTALRSQPALKLQHLRSPQRWMSDWRNGKVSNFEYLMYLNRQAGRSFKDLTQYPVFPWIISDYSSPNLDLSNPACFRDLSKPIGALNAKRLAEFRERFIELRRMCEASNIKLPGSLQPLEFPPFLYGCHYSTPGYVVYYLMRSEPQLMLRLQNGRFDAPDRLFWSLMDTWKSVTTLPTDVKELIPEFYSTDPSFLLNLENIDFGTRAAGEKVGDTELPPWASDAQDFVQKLAEALESPMVSARLHRWIDLIFGYKSRGLAAEKADNVFHYLTYDDIALRQLKQEADPVMREALRVQMMEFGRTPHMLFTKKHPRRRVVATGARPAFCCFKPQPPERSAPTSNVLRPVFQKKSKSQSPTVRAVARLTSSKPVIRLATLQWLEQTAALREPEYLCLNSHAELLPVVKALRECRSMFPEAEDMPRTLVRALRVLAIAPQNRGLILDAGAIEPLTELLCCGICELSEPSLHAVALLAREEDARLNTFSEPALGCLLGLLTAADASLEIRATAAATIASLSRSMPNRMALTRQDGLNTLLEVIRQRDTGPLLSSPRDAPRVAREATASLLALLDDDQNKLDAVEKGALPTLVDMCAARGPDTDLRALAAQCLAAVSMHDDLKAVLLASGAVPVLCRIARSRDVSLQQPAAAVLANLSSNGAFIGQASIEQECFASLNALALSPDTDVQRHVARAFWHVASTEDNRARILEHGGLGSLLRLAQADNKGIQSQSLARQALRRLADDAQLRSQLPPDAQASLDAAVSQAALSPVLPLLSPGRNQEAEEAYEGGAMSPSGVGGSPTKRRKHRRLQSAVDEKGHGEVKRQQSGMEEGPNPFGDTDIEEGSTEEWPNQDPKPSLLHRLGFWRTPSGSSRLAASGATGSGSREIEERAGSRESCGAEAPSPMAMQGASSDLPAEISISNASQDANASAVVNPSGSPLKGSLQTNCMADSPAEHCGPVRVSHDAAEAPGDMGDSNASTLLDNSGSAGAGSAGGSLTGEASARANGYSLEQKVVGDGRRTDHDRGVSSTSVGAVVPEDGQNRGRAEER